jgi:sigma-B regulation protein RsbU (phosphoserine phosphatase)
MAETLNRQAQTYSLEDFLDAATLQEIQAAFVAGAGIEICFYDRAGRRVTEPADAARFCPHRGPAGSEGGDALGAAVAAACKEAAGGPVCVHCDGQHDHMAIPVRSGRQLLGMLVVGEDQSDVPAASKSVAGVQEALSGLEAAEGTAGAGLAELLANLLSRMCYQDMQLRLRIEELGALYGISGLLAGSFDLQHILDEVVRRVAEVMRVKSTSLRLFDEDTGELVIKAVNGLSAEYLGKGSVRVSENPVDAQALSGQTVYIEDLPNDPRVRYPEQARREGLRSGLVAGMFYRGKPVGVLRAYAAEKHRFSAFEAGLLRAMAAQAASAIETARLYQEQLQADRVRKQIAMAGDVQRRMIPAGAPQHARLTFGTVYEPSLGVGGDFYDFIEFPDGRIGLAIADVVGKGIPAALMMASVRSVLRATALTGRRVSRVIEDVNRHLSRDTLINEFATLFYCVVSQDGRRLTYCNAGHNPPLLLRGGRISELAEGGLVIGIHRDEHYGQSRVGLRAGDVVLLYTDGITEALSFDGRRFGIERLRESLRKYGSLAARPIVNNILWDVRRFVGLAEQSDDQTMVAIKLK